MSDQLIENPGPENNEITLELPDNAVDYTSGSTSAEKKTLI